MTTVRGAPGNRKPHVNGRRLLVAIGTMAITLVGLALSVVLPADRVLAVSTVVLAGATVVVAYAARKPPVA